MICIALSGSAMGQKGRGKGPMGMGKGPMGKGQNAAAFAADHDLLQGLLTHRADIRRDVQKTPNGVETLTESDKPDVAAAIQKHVASMEARVKNRIPIHARDPLFAELFRHADKIKFVYKPTAKGMHIIEASDDPYVVRLIQAHADVVSLFLKNGFDEVRRNHDVPAKL
jgi:hypothetical protein